MPNFDGTGPQGKGPKTGQGLGQCNTNSTPLQGTGLGRGPGAGLGRGPGAGRGIRQGQGRNRVN